MPNFTGEQIRQVQEALYNSAKSEIPRGWRDHAIAALTAAIPEGMVLVSEKLIDKARAMYDAMADGEEHGEGADERGCPVCDAMLEFAEALAAHSAAQEKKP